MPERSNRFGIAINGVIPGGGTCVIDGCGARAPRDALMCPPHWRLVPHGLKDNVAYVVGRWRRKDGVTHGEVRAAQWACVDAITGAARDA